jgi:predicted DNA-binding WGR domain protein
VTVDVRVRTAEAVFEERAGGATLRLGADGHRDRPRLVAALSRPDVVRDALTVFGRIVQSDLRRRASDRSDYLAFLLKQGKRATKELWEAQKAFLEEKLGDATESEAPLDPIVTVSEDGLTFEALSGDESMHARLVLHAGQAFEAREQKAGTSHVAVSDGLLETLGGLRHHQQTTLELGPAGDDAPERELSVPERWLRAFTQVEAASTLPGPSFELAPVDFYNLLFTLRMRRAKKAPRALRWELVPGEVPRMVLEPWDEVIEGTGAPYEGPPRIVRTWGRRRLLVVSPLLAHLRSVRVHPSGPGLPVFYELDLGDCTLTLALSGWTDRGWAGIGNFDLLVPLALDAGLQQKALERLKQGPATIDELASATGGARDALRAALLAEIQRGLVTHERGSGRYRYRELLAEPLDAERLRYRDAVEEEAHRLLAEEGQVRILKAHDLGAEGFRIEGEVEDRRARRSYKTSFTIDREGRTVDASCTSRQFRRSGLKEGPSAPMIALRLSYARQRKELEEARQTEEGRKLIRAETRTLMMRDDEGSVLARVSLDDTQVRIRWGRHDESARFQRLLFGTAEDARIEYFRRLDRLADRGFIDATAAEAAG